MPVGTLEARRTLPPRSANFFSAKMENDDDVVYLGSAPHTGPRDMEGGIEVRRGREWHALTVHLPPPTRRRRINAPEPWRPRLAQRPPREWLVGTLFTEREVELLDELRGGANCTVCMEPLDRNPSSGARNQMSTVLPPCTHPFHVKCVLAVHERAARANASFRCPLCRNSYPMTPGQEQDMRALPEQSEEVGGGLLATRTSTGSSTGASGSG